MGFFDSIKDFFVGSPAGYEQVSNLTPTQSGIQRQLEKASKRRGAGGAFGKSADFYRDILSNRNGSIESLYAPELRQFNEQIIPDLAEQFAGMGSGALSSSGFRNSAVNAGTDLSERLAAMRQQLRFNAAQGLRNIGSQALNPHASYQQTSPGSEGFLSNIAPAVGTAIGSAVGGPVGGAIGGGLGSLFKSSPYGDNNPSAPQTGSFTSQPQYKGSFGQLPNFGGY